MPRQAQGDRLAEDDSSRDGDTEVGGEEGTLAALVEAVAPDQGAEDMHTLGAEDLDSDGEEDKHYADLAMPEEVDMDALPLDPGTALAWMDLVEGMGSCRL